MIQDDQKGRKKNIRYVLKGNRKLLLHGRNQHKEEEEDTSIGPAGRENKGTKKQSKNNDKQDNKCHYCRFRAPPVQLNENKQRRQKQKATRFTAIS